MFQEKSLVEIILNKTREKNGNLVLNLSQLACFFPMLSFDPVPVEIFIAEVKRKCWEEMGCSSKFFNIPTNMPRVLLVETTWKRLFPRRFNVEYTRCVCRDRFVMPENKLPLKVFLKIFLIIKNTIEHFRAIYFGIVCGDKFFF